MKNIGLYSKSLATLLTGVNGWILFVVHSPSKQVTADEWALLVGIGIAFLLTFLVPNASKSTPAAVPLADLPHEGGGIPIEAIPLLEHVVGGSWTPPNPLDVGGVPSKAAQP